MGRKAKKRAERREELPRWIVSETFGLVDTQDFKGCQVVKWDFEADQPVVLLNEETHQVHFNCNFVRPDLTPEDVLRIGNSISDDVELLDVTRTNF